ncbi:MAG TPA: D-alanyl-D-alanine carboxypeptidase family protein [Blastocatellia bacterium]|nr:D-alanyl-D-alanine carboxypeptidase family protein [Blastocatellia bacterium]
MSEPSVLRRLATALLLGSVTAFAAIQVKAADSKSKARQKTPEGVASVTLANPSSAIKRPAGIKSVGRDSRTASRSSAGRALKPNAACGQCGKEATAARGGRNGTRGAKVKTKLACHPKGYVDPKIAKNLNAALRDMRRAGIKPSITSAWRSTGDQAYLHRCSHSRRCRLAHGVYGAMPAGRSMHEAGFAVDIAGIASGRRGERRLTSKGRRVVQIMKRNGFNWRYGLADPAHFEVDPKKRGYRNVLQAIKLNQSRCQFKPVAKKVTPRKAAPGRKHQAKLSSTNRKAPTRTTAQARPRKPMRPTAGA